MLSDDGWTVSWPLLTPEVMSPPCCSWTRGVGDGIELARLRVRLVIELGCRPFVAVRRRWLGLTSEPPSWFLIFSHCYLYSILLHYGKRWTDPETTVGFSFLCLWATLRPKRVEPFVVAQIVVLIATIGEYPRLANHSSIQMFVAVYVCLLAGSAFIGSRAFSYSHLAVGLRGLAVVVYFLTGFHKINAGFLNPVTSCANWYHSKFLSAVFGYAGGLPDVVFHWSPWLVIIVELSACSLLCCRRTWKWGLCVILPVHLYVSLSGFVDFSSMMHSVMLLFLPCTFWTHGGSTLKRMLSVYRASIAAIVGITYFQIDKWLIEQKSIDTFQGVVFDLAVLCFVIVLIVELRRFSRSERRREAHLGGRRRWYFGALPTLIFLWGSIPYLGLSTNGSLTMFSNLVTAPGYGNHLIVDTDATSVFSFQDDLVRVIDIEPMLGSQFRYPPTGNLLTRSEIAYHVNRTIEAYDRRLPADLVEAGRRVRYEDLRFSSYNEWPLWNRWLSFREIDPIGDAKCRW